MTTEHTGGGLIGKSVRRVEDPRLLTGKGCYVDDMQLPGMLHLTFLRSPYPHATIRAIQTSAAQAMPGVVAIVTGDDLSEGLHVPVMPDGAFYAWADCSAWHESSWDLVFELMKSAHVALSPGRDFGPHAAARYLRLSFANSMENLQEAVRRIAKATPSPPCGRGLG